MTITDIIIATNGLMIINVLSRLAATYIVYGLSPVDCTFLVWNKDIARKIKSCRGHAG